MPSKQTWFQKLSILEKIKHFNSTFQFNIWIQHFSIISTSFQRQTSKVDPGVRLLKQDSSLIMFSLNMLDSSVFLQSHSLIKCLRQTDKPSPTDAIAANNKCDKTPDLGLTHSHSHVSGTSSATLSTKQQQDEDYWATKQYSGHITTLVWMLRTIQIISSFENLFILYSLLSPKFMCNKRKLYDTFSKVSEESKIFTNAMSSKRKKKRKQWKWYVHFYVRFTKYLIDSSY